MKRKCKKVAIFIPTRKEILVTRTERLFILNAYSAIAKQLKSAAPYREIIEGIYCENDAEKYCMNLNVVREKLSNLKQPFTDSFGINAKPLPKQPGDVRVYNLYDVMKDGRKCLFNAKCMYLPIDCINCEDHASLRHSVEIRTDIFEMYEEILEQDFHFIQFYLERLIRTKFDR